METFEVKKYKLTAKIFVFKKIGFFTLQNFEQAYFAGRPPSLLLRLIDRKSEKMNIFKDEHFSLL